MSKTALRKQLREMPREELEQVVMELYESRKEVKDYFDFYLDPDVDRLMDRYRKLLLKEASRCSRGYSRCRISAIRRLIKEFSGFNSGREYEMEMMVWTLKMLVDKERDVRYRETLYNGTARLMRDIIAFSDRHLMADRAMAHVTSLLANKNLATDHFRRLLKQELENLV